MSSRQLTLFLSHWRATTLAAVLLLSLIGIMSVAPIAQDPGYHDLADKRTIFGVANFVNVVSNIPFLLIGIAGLTLCRGLGKTPTGVAWTTFFAGTALISIGSGYYHMVPASTTLVWDRLPMTVAFMALFAALLSEQVNESFGRTLLWPAVALGLVSVVWWHCTDDLRLYVWVQAAPLAAIPLALFLFPPRYTHRRYLLYGVGLYALAKVAEVYDRELFALTAGTASGHSMKHLLAAAGILSVYLMLARRRRL